MRFPVWPSLIIIPFLACLASVLFFPLIRHDPDKFLWLDPILFFSGTVVIEGAIIRRIVNASAWDSYKISFLANLASWGVVLAVYIILLNLHLEVHPLYFVIISATLTIILGIITWLKMHTRFGLACILCGLAGIIAISLTRTLDATLGFLCLVPIYFLLSLLMLKSLVAYWIKGAGKFPIATVIATFGSLLCWLITEVLTFIGNEFLSSLYDKLYPVQSSLY